LVKRVSAAADEDEVEVEDSAPTVHVSSTEPESEPVDADDEDEDEDEDDLWGKVALNEVAPRNAFVALPTVHPPVEDEQPGMEEQPTRVWSGCCCCCC
jgi:hypothetical protein